MDYNETLILTNLTSSDLIEVIKGIQDLDKALKGFDY